MSCPAHQTLGAELLRPVRVIPQFEGMRTIIPAPPLLRSNQTPVTVLPRLRAFLVGAWDGTNALEGHAVGS